VSLENHTSIWEMDEDERRIAIAKFASSRAAKQRRINNPHTFNVPSPRVLPEKGNADELHWTDKATAEVLRFRAEGHSFAEIGMAMGCSRSAVHGLVTRLKRKKAALDVAA